MAGAHELPEAIQWHEGMLLAPQHFQQLSLRQEELLSYHLRMVAPFHWGLTHLRHDTVLLVSGTYRITELEGIMPDGLVVSRDSQESDALELDLTPMADDMKQHPVTLNLVVASRKLGEPPIKGDLPRYGSIEGIPTVDENTGESELRIPRLRPKLSIVAGDSIPKKYSGFPVAQVSLKDETYTLTDFITPTVQVPLHSPLGDMCSSVARRLRQKAVFLSEQTRSPALATEGAAFVEMKETIKSLVLGLPHLEAALYTGAAHPLTLYLALCLVSGELSSLGPGMVPPMLAPYNHDDLRATFIQIRDFLFKMLDFIHEAYNAISFTYQKGRWNLPLLAVWMREKLTIGVRANVGQTEDSVAEWFEKSIIGSQPRIEGMMTRRILGPQRQRVDKDQELGLVATAGVALYSVKFDPLYIELGEPLQVFNPEAGEAKRPADIILYVKP
ncbi:MAG TPA: type VI secretion system baseplate subunit TssK [Terriglobia bacterium]|jgi:type VI secretion system protein ImpJ